MDHEAKAYIEQIGNDINNSRKSRLWKDSVNLLSTVSESIFSRTAHFVLELLQNAEDACSRIHQDAGEIRFSVFENRVEVEHNGAVFDKSDVDSICGVRSSKRPELGTLGYLGIGFKSVFKITDSPEIHSGGFHFRFDKHAYSDPGGEPWQILPIWIDVGDREAENSFTRFVLPFRQPGTDAEVLRELRKIDVSVFLFLKRLKRLTVLEPPERSSVVIERSGDHDRIVSLSKNGKVHRFAIFRSVKAVPEHVASDPVLEFYKRQRVKQREIVIAFGVDENGNLGAVEDAGTLGSVSSFLPLVEERSGAKFLIQSDFLVQPGREAIQYEVLWNQWLMSEAAELAKDAVAHFKTHPTWNLQFLPLFEFTQYAGQPAYEKLFKPTLHDPLEAFLNDSEVYPTTSGTHARPDKVVDPGPHLQGLLSEPDLQFLFPGENDLHLASRELDIKSVPESVRSKVRSLTLGQVGRNKALLEAKVADSEDLGWFTSLYSAMAGSDQNFKQVQRQGRKGRIEWVDEPIYVVTERRVIVRADVAYLREIPIEVQKLREKYPEVDRVMGAYQQIHPNLETPELSPFFKAHTHVQSVDYDKICKDVFLPRLRVSAAPPSKEEAVAYTRLLQKGSPVWEPIWVVTKKDNLKPSNQAFLGSAYSPAEDWETNSRYCSQVDFLSADYLQDVPAGEVAAWKQFFIHSGVGVKERAEEPYVSCFAVALVKDALASELRDFITKERQKHGYDLEATGTVDGSLVYLEVKGQKSERAVELEGNEPTAATQAKQKGHPFWVCVVPGIPENPQVWVVDDPLSAGDFKSLTIELSKWKTRGRRIR